MDFGIRDRVAIVTGAARSLGRADAEVLAQEGCRVAVLDLNAEGAAEAAREIAAQGATARGYACDVRDAGQVGQVVAAVERDLGPVAICVNNAGFIYTVSQLKDTRLEDWETNLAINLTGTFNVTKAVFPGMRERRWGRIVCMASIAGLMGGFGQTAYATTKMGVVGFAKSVALEGARHNVTCNVIAPGIVGPNAKLSPMYDRMVKRVAMQREGEPEDIAWAVTFLCSERARYITGAVLNVTGGMDLFTFGQEDTMPTVKEVFDQMAGRFRADKAAGTNTIVQYDISGDGGGTWHAVIKDGACAVKEGAGTNPSLTLQMAAQDWLDMVSGKQSGQMLFMSGKLKLKGDMGLAMKLGSMFSM